MPNEADATVLDKELYISVTSGGGMFCGQHAEGYAINGTTYNWPRSVQELTWGITFSKLGQLSDMDVKDAITAFLAEIAEVCDRKFRYMPNANGANIMYTSRSLDGPSGVLADMQIPVGNVNGGTQLLGRFDDGENWTLAENPANGTIDFYRVGLHETEHAMGLGHKPASIQQPALIAPIYSPVIRHLLKDTDVSELLRRYGPKIAIPVEPTTPVTPIPGAKPVTLESTNILTQGTMKWQAKTTTTMIRVA